MIKICLNAGHGGKDTGALNGSLIEKNMNLITAKQAQSELLKRGFDVMMTRIDDTYVSITEACNMANKWGAHLTLSIHYNSYNGLADRGEIIYAKGDSNGKRLADIIAWCFNQVGQAKVNEFTKEQEDGKPWYGMIRQTNMTCVICEPCFIDNAEDRKIADTEEEQKIIGTWYAKAICEYFNVPWEIPEPPKEEVKVEPMFNDINEVADYARQSVEKATKVFKGDENGNFKPNDFITRQDFAVILDRLGFLG